MKGTIILTPSPERPGIIRGTDDKRYTFQIQDLLSPGKTQVGYETDFEPGDGRAFEICILNTSTKSFKSPLKESIDVASVREKASHLLETSKSRVHSLPTVKNVYGVIAALVFLIALMLPLFDLEVMGYGYPGDPDLSNNAIMTFLILIAIASIALFALDLNRLYLKIASVVLLALMIGLTITAFSAASEINQIGSNAQGSMNQLLGAGMQANTPDMGDMAKVVPQFGFYLAAIALVAQFYTTFFGRNSQN